MGATLWAAVDNYFNERLAAEDDALRAAVQSCRQAGMPEIQISPTQGKLLMLLARAIQARSAPVVAADFLIDIGKPPICLIFRPTGHNLQPKSSSSPHHVAS